ncbi:MAG: ATP-dependent RecD-like DNA helicase [Bacilli bacterium]|nr:ATP-dependent RecD-like DNA helicase [Bacilli bacterium]MBN2877069.1 ATP-dependent RecD-like DNA helicase [Bacilli bacterium]
MSYIDGSINRYLFFNEENSYSVIKIKIIDTDEIELTHYEPTIIVCGFFPKLDNFTNYRFHGSVTYHNKYGIQYNATSFERIVDNTYTGLVDYLSSDLFKGIGKKTAERIVDKLGLSALDLIAESKYVLDDIPRINNDLRDSIYLQIVEHRDMEQTLVWLYGFDISPKMAIKIYSVYGNSTIETIKENPYVLMDEVEGIGFRRADEIGLKVGFSYDSPLRIQAVIYYLMNEFMNKYGDTYLERERLIDFTLKYLDNEEFSIDPTLVQSRLDSLIENGRIIQKAEALSLAYLYKAEQFIAKKVLEFDQELDLKGTDLNQFITEFESRNDITYTDAQRKAIITALSHQMTIITGGPGTGKTTVIKGIVDIYAMLHDQKKDKERIALAAPTGKAAKRLAAATEMEANTIHKLLGYDFEGHFNRDSDNPLTQKLIIIDEVSMMDVLLARRLFDAIRYHSQVILVGDANQLPSVGPGDVLHDLIRSDLFSIVKLDIIHRQAEHSNIISLAYDILNQEINRTIFDHYPDRDFMRVREQFVSDKILSEIKHLIQMGYDLLEDIQVLIPVYKGQTGIDRINDLIQQMFNSENKNFNLSYKDKTFYYNDKVMQLVNQPEDNVMNGDQGIVSGITEDDELLVNFSGNIVKYNLKDLDNLTLAYAVSIHKSQGSEYQCVILPMVRSYTIMLKRKLLYTAVTRAKEKLILIGDFEAYKRGVLGQDTPRNTLLRVFLQEEINRKSDSELTIEDFL